MESSFFPDLFVQTTYLLYASIFNKPLAHNMLLFMQTVYDKDRFSGDDKMGNTEIDLRPFLEAHQMELDFQKLPNGCAIKRIRLGRTNGLAEESTITWSNGKIIQNMILRLRNMECGEIEIMLKLTAGPGFSGLGREENSDCVEHSQPSPKAKIVYDKDTFTSHDKMGDAQIVIKPFLEVHKLGLQELPGGTEIKRVLPTRENCLSEESRIFYHNGKIVQDMILVLRNVQCGEVEIQLEWIKISGGRRL
ncbi:hypothetical protein YC2023_079044 [Brassica napus]